MFTIKDKNLGELKVGKKTTIKYKSTEALDIMQLSSSCGCSRPSYDRRTKTLTVNYKPQSIPRQRINEGNYFTKKYITVILTDGTNIKLSFSATIIK